MRSPFKFLDAYSLEDKDHFFGREEEVDTLYRMVFKTPLVLVYGLSGTGKTSLIRCGLASRFDGPDWYPVYIRKQADINASLRTALATALGGEMPADLTEAVRQLYRQNLRPVYLILDQFEELFIMGDWAEQQQLAVDLAGLMSTELPCTIMLVMREEYIGRLYHFEKAIPTLFDFRLRVEPMTTTKVETVLLSSFEKFNIALESPVEDSLRAMIDNISLGRSGIQLPYLQVYLDQLYREDYQRTYGEEERGDHLPPLTFTRREIADFGPIENVLEKFLQQQEVVFQHKLARHYPGVAPDAVRRVLDVFVTEEGTKRPLHFTREEDSKQVILDEEVLSLLPSLSPEVVNQCLIWLEQSRLIRFSDTDIELAHDSLAVLIDQQRTDEQRQLNEVKRRIQNNYLEYQRTGEYLSRKKLNAFEEYLPRLALAAPVKTFIEASENYQDQQEAEEKARQQRELELARQKLEAEHQASRRQRLISFVISIAALVAIALGLWAYSLKIEAVEATQNLSEEVFKNQMTRVESFRREGFYQDATDQLKEARAFVLNPDTRLPDSLVRKCDDLLVKYEKVAQLMSKADSLVQEDATLRQSLDLYRQAYSIFPDQRIRNLIHDGHQHLESQFADYKYRAQKILAYGGCAYALDLLEIAHQLKPEDAYINQQLERCR